MITAKGKELTLPNGLPVMGTDRSMIETNPIDTILTLVDAISDSPEHLAVEINRSQKGIGSGHRCLPAYAIIAVGNAAMLLDHYVTTVAISHSRNTAKIGAHRGPIDTIATFTDAVQAQGQKAPLPVQHRTVVAILHKRPVGTGSIAEDALVRDAHQHVVMLSNVQQIKTGPPLNW